MSATARESVPLILDGKYFEVVDVTGKCVTATCLACNKNVKGSFSPTSNFTSHLKEKHKELHEEYKKYLSSGQVKRQKTLSFPVISTISTEKQRTDRVIIDYIVQSMSPIWTVEKDYFKNLVKGLNSNAAAPTRKTLTNWIDQDFDNRKLHIQMEIGKPAWLCATADIWSARRRSFMGVTCHWINNDYERKSVMLSLKRFHGRHTSERIAEILNKIFNSFKIGRKIVYVITDNGSNFCKAFREYQAEVDTAESQEIEEDDTVDENGQDNENLIQMEEIYTIIDEQPFTGLPPHYRCVSHTLSLIATTDLNSELSSGFKDRRAGACKSLFRSTMGKCAAFWNKNSRSVQVAEMVHPIFEKCVIKPVVTRWNSTFDAIQLLVEKSNVLDSAFEAAGVPPLSAQEKEFLKAYNHAMEPVAWSLDKLQGQNNLFFGFLLPVLLKCDKKLEAISNGDCTNAKYIALALRGGLQKRFKDILSLNTDAAKNEILAAICLPCFKMRWVPDDKKESLKKLFIAEADIHKKGLPVSQQTASTVATSSTDAVLDDLFDFNVSTEQESFIDAEVECIKYLQDTDSHLHSLKIYPIVKDMFMKYNTPLPSSAPAERVFSYGGMILRPQRARLTDENFEKLVFLKLNQPV